LDAAAAQPFHLGHPEGAVADDIPTLLDQLIEFLVRHGPPSVDAGPPLEEPAIRAAAERHTRARIRQGLQAADIVVEFRLLRQEIWRCLRTDLPEDAPPDDVTAATLLVNDAIDGVITLGIEALLERLEQVRQQALATILHDLRTPITAVKGWAQIILRREQPEPSLAQPILDAANRLQRMTDDLLEVGQIESGQLTLERGFMDLTERIQSVAASLTIVAPNHLLRVEAPDGPVTGVWDGERLARVIENLVTNAIKYSPPETEVVLEIIDGGAYAEVSIRDQGLGLPDGQAARIFDQFYRVRENASGAEGLGLGLFIARSFVEAHGGRIRAESPGPNQGTTVTFTLPRGTAAETAPPASRL
jgi:signal transduction histidine kinase